MTQRISEKQKVDMAEEIKRRFFSSASVAPLFLLSYHHPLPLFIPFISSFHRWTGEFLLRWWHQIRISCDFHSDRFPRGGVSQKHLQHLLQTYNHKVKLKNSTQRWSWCITFVQRQQIIPARLGHACVYHSVIGSGLCCYFTVWHMSVSIIAAAAHQPRHSRLKRKVFTVK